MKVDLTNSSNLTASEIIGRIYDQSTMGFLFKNV